METTDFLRGVLGDNGHYCIFAARSKDKKRIQKFYDTVEEVEQAANKFNADGFDVYFALSTFKEPTNRKGSNAQELKSLFLDLDCGPSKEYPTQQAAIEALRGFCKQLSLPRPTMVNSGRGVHVYWSLTEAVSAEDWVDVAETLKQACASNGLLADPSVTADVARILRIPETHNYKDDPPLKVELLGVDPAKPIVLSDFAKKISVSKPVTNVELDVDALYQSSIPSKKQVEQILSYLDPEDREEWVSVGHSLKATDESFLPLFIAFSEGSFCGSIPPNYKSHEDVIESWNSFNPSRTNFGSLVNRARAKGFDDKLSFTFKECEGEVIDEGFRIPEYPSPYFRGMSGGVFLRSSNADGDVEEEIIYHHDIYITRRLHDEELGETLVFRLHLPKDGVRQFSVPLTHVTSREEFRKSMAREGVTAWGRNLDKLMAYTTKWVDELQKTSKADEAHRQFGWVDDGMEEFVLGDKLITGAEISYNPPSSKTAGLIDAFEPKGSREKNIELLNFYNKKGWELHQYIVGVGFGSPLMALTGLNSMAVHLHGGSGVGKTTAEMACLSLWGNPEELMNAKDDTHNARMNRGEIMHSLPLVSDEMTNVTSREMSEYVYQISGGRQKNRLASNGNIERTRGKPWQLLAISSGNTSAWEILSRDKAMPKAEMQRLFEIQVKKLVNVVGQNVDTSDLFKELKKNYGWIGPEYTQWVINNKEEAKRTVESVKRRIDVAAGLGPENRFWSNGNAVILAGLIIANKLGFVRYDVGAVYRWVVKELIIRNNFVNDIGASVSQTLNNYLSENYNNMLKIESTQDLRGSNDSSLDQLVPVSASPRGFLVARYEPDTKLLFLRIKPFREWCIDQQINYASLVDDLKDKLNAKRIKKRLTKGTDFNLPPDWVLEMKFEELDEGSDGSESDEA